MSLWRRFRLWLARCPHDWRDQGGFRFCVICGHTPIEAEALDAIHRTMR